MQFSETHEFSSDRDAILNLFTRCDYFLSKYERLGALDIEVLACEDDGERFHIQVRRRVPQHTPFPGFIRKVVGENVTLIQSDTWWRSTAEGFLEIQVQGAPVSVAAEMRLEDIGGGSRLRLDFDVRARVPVVAGKIEAFMGRDLMRRMAEDMAMSEQLLEGRQ